MVGSCGGHGEPGDHAIGRSRGGPAAKIHLACDGHGRPLSIVLTGGRPPAFDRTAYERRNVVERCFNRLKQFRAIATRFDKTATSCRGMPDLATPLICL